uniref:Uncharacterized protein n=1 Tax=Lepeophtheirus salmonis TaxID=72036 RepID=A0A0K2UAN9_LEPSM
MTSHMDSSEFKGTLSWGSKLIVLLHKMDNFSRALDENMLCLARRVDLH